MQRTTTLHKKVVADSATAERSNLLSIRDDVSPTRVDDDVMAGKQKPVLTGGTNQTNKHLDCHQSTKSYEQTSENLNLDRKRLQLSKKNLEIGRFKNANEAKHGSVCRNPVK